MHGIEQVIKATKGRVVLKGNAFFSGVSIDSRTIKERELFIALKGKRFDGHDFIFDALRLGQGAIVHNLPFDANDPRFLDKTIILVNDTLQALHDIARDIRMGFKGHVIGIVGSNGKTTTKEIISSILSTRLNVLKTRDNLNNQIGMPLSIINGFYSQAGDAAPDVMVLEMGANRPHDIDDLCSIAMPDIGVVTNIGYEHIEGFGSLHNVRESELEILSYIKRLIVNADDRFLMDGVNKRFKGEVITFGIEKEDADLRVADIVFSEKGTSFTICTRDECISVNSKLIGRFNVYNCIAASATAYSLGFDLQAIKKGLEVFNGVKMRFEVKKCRGATFLNDVYNANPSSMQEALKELTRLLTNRGSRRYKRAIAVLGDMLELGDLGVQAHKDLGRMMSYMPIDVFIGVGHLMPFAISEFRGKGIHVNTSEDAGLELKKIIRDEDIVLIKGSRGMKMERVLTIAEGSEGDDKH